MGTIGRRLSRRAVLRLAGGSLLATTAGATGTAAYAFRIEPGWFDVERVSLALPRLAPAFAGYRLVQLSDIHMDDWMTPGRLGGIVEIVNALAPDLVAITGDFVTYEPGRFAPHLVAALRRLRARDGIVATLGNHDHWTDAATVRAVLADSGIRELSNDVHVLLRGADRLHLAGIDDYRVRQDRLDLVLERLPAPSVQEQGAAILLAHEPDFADISAATGRFDLQLSGHSHGGQVSPILLGPIIVPPFARKYPKGRYQVDGMIQYTSRGLGMIRPYVRFGCRPEITLFTLQPGQL